MNSSTSPRPIPSLPATACHHCGTVDIPQLAPGNGPHAFRATCRHCGAFLRWVSKYTPAERVARRVQALPERAIHTMTMRGRPATTPQLALLKALGYEGAAPANRAEAHQLITQLRQKGGAA